MRTALQNPNETNHYEAHVGSRIGEERFIVKAKGIRAILASYRTAQDAAVDLAADETITAQWWDGEQWKETA